MKNIFIGTLLVAFSFPAFAQIPEKMSYQAVVRDAVGNLVTNQAIGIQISILKTSTNGTAVYVETQNPSTNANGLLSLEIGSGNVVNGNFSAINWDSDSYFIKTEIDPSGGNSYTVTGTSQLLSVPYALSAKKADNGLPSGNYGDILYNDGNTWIQLPIGTQGQLLTVIGGLPTWVSSDKEKPTLPTNFTATATSESTISLSWNASTDNVGVAYYRLEQGNISNPTNVVTTSETFYEATGLNTYNNYSWRLYAIDVTGNVAPSGVPYVQAGATTLDFTPPDPPSNLTASDITNTSVRLSWNAADDHIVGMEFFGIKKYIIRQNGAIISSAQYYNNPLTYTVNNLSTSTTYNFTVQAEDYSGNFSVESSLLSVTTAGPDTTVDIGEYWHGGIVFWIDPNDSSHGLVCDVSDIDAPLGWGCYALDLPATFSNTGIGYGLANSNAITNECTTQGIAADICLDATINGYSDWYLPSEDELNEMFLRRTAVNAGAIGNGGQNFSNNYYWCSNQYDAFFAKKQNLVTGVKTSDFKGFNLSKIRAIRSF